MKWAKLKIKKDKQRSVLAVLFDSNNYACITIIIIYINVFSLSFTASWNPDDEVIRRSTLKSTFISGSYTNCIVCFHLQAS